jgi:hypothetical protein
MIDFEKKLQKELNSFKWFAILVTAIQIIGAIIFFGACAAIVKFLFF